MNSELQQYVAGCELCHSMEAPCHPYYRLNMALSLPSCPWEWLTMDSVTDLPKIMALGYTGNLVIIDRLTKMVTYLHSSNHIDSLELAWTYFEHIICKRGVPDNANTDCSKEFPSQFWDSVCSQHAINQQLLTAFQQQMDAQTAQHNPMEGQYLRAFCNYEQSDWAELWPLAEFV